MAWLEDLSESEREQLERASTSIRYGAGETIFRPSKEPRSVYLLQRGAARIYRLSESGAEATFGYVRPGEVFGELSAVTQHARESWAEAVEDSTVWRLPIAQFRRLLGSRPGVATAVSRQLGDRLKRIERRVEDLVFHDARARLASILLELADHFGIEAERGVELDGDFTQGELATLVGCTRQTLNQNLGELAELGLVQIERRRVRLPDPAGLRRAADRGAEAASGAD